MHHGHPGIFLDGPQAQRTVAAHARENDADGLFLLVRRQLPEEEVDRHPQAPRRGRFQHLQLSVQDGQVRIGRDHVDVVGLDLHPVFRLDDLHLGVPPEQFRHHAFVGRFQVRHEDERQAGVRGQVGEELREGLEPARRAAHADDAESRPDPGRPVSPRRERGKTFCGLPGRGFLVGFFHAESPILIFGVSHSV